MLEAKTGYVKCDGSQGKRNMQEKNREEKKGASPLYPIYPGIFKA